MNDGLSITPKLNNTAHSHLFIFYLEKWKLNKNLMFFVHLS
jgi:hypothetical protein